MEGVLLHCFRLASGLALDWQSERGLCLLRKRLRRIRASQGDLININWKLFKRFDIYGRSKQTM